MCRPILSILTLLLAFSIDAWAGSQLEHTLDKGRDTFHLSDGTMQYGRYVHRHHTFYRLGYWKEFDVNGRLLAKRHYRHGVLHGQVRDYIADTSAQYRYGHNKDALRNSDGRRLVMLFTYGLSWYPDCGRHPDSIAVGFVPVGGCVVDWQIRLRARIHNAAVWLHRSFQYGPGWLRRFEDCYAN